ncbi:PRD domain-containing protein [Staphylococcus aureus]
MLQPNPLRQKSLCVAILNHELITALSPIEQDAAIRFNEDELTYITIHFASYIACCNT